MQRSTIYLLSFLFLFTSTVYAERIKDLTSIYGVRSNQLVGYGLVVGLDGSGDQSAPFTEQSMKNMLRQLGISLPPGTKMPLKNVAAVSLSAELPPFAKPGQKIDVTVSSIANAKSLRGGTLLMSPLKGADRKVYALAQGNLIVGGLGISADDGSKITINIPSVGRIPDGATVERMVANPFAQGDFITLNLHQADFTTAHRLADIINETFGKGTAQEMDAISVRVRAPLKVSQRVSFVSVLENLQVLPAEAPAKVIVNSRTGTVVIGQNVRVSPAAVSHGNLIVTITNTPQVSQPDALSEGETVVTPQSDIAVEKEDNKMFLFNPGVSLDEIVKSINKVGVGPGDLVAILEALKSVGALKAELIVI